MTIINMLINTVLNKRYNLVLSFWSSATYLMTPFWIPIVENVSTETSVLRKLPIIAMPEGPINIASIFPATTPAPIFTNTLTAFSDDTLNKVVRNMSLSACNSKWLS